MSNTIYDGQASISVCGVRNISGVTLETQGRAAVRYVNGVQFLDPDEVAGLSEHELEEYFLVAPAFVGADLKLQILRGQI
jgi:hypothetical protein